MRPTKKASYPKQLAANRAIAAKSTGPKTPEGKARSARNSLKHGFTASSFAIVRLEDLQEIAHLKCGLISVYQPVNAQELFALERMALCQQSMLRAARLEAGLLTTALNQTFDAEDRPFTSMNNQVAGDRGIEVTRAQDRNYGLASGFLSQVSQSNPWFLFLRHQAQAERHYRRALEEFDRLKALRHELPNETFPDEPIVDPQPQQESSTCIDTNLSPPIAVPAPSPATVAHFRPPEANHDQNLPEAA